MYVMTYYTKYVPTFQSPSKVLESLLHYFSYPNTNNYSLQGKKPSDFRSIFQDLANLEKEYLEKNKQSVINHSIDYKEKEYKPEMFIDFGDGWAWFILNSPSCDVEARGMGHCGNAGNPQEGERILSLRQKSSIGQDNYKPFLTFILDKNGKLGEMKGSANTKPNKKYHMYIKSLLLNPAIKGLKGAGYMPENNFSIFDFENYEDLIEISKVKPKIVPSFYLDLIAGGPPPNKDQIKALIDKNPENAMGLLYQGIEIPRDIIEDNLSESPTNISYFIKSNNCDKQLVDNCLHEYPEQLVKLKDDK